MGGGLRDGGALGWESMGLGGIRDWGFRDGGGSGMGFVRWGGLRDRGRAEGWGGLWDVEVLGWGGSRIGRL